MEFSSSDEPSAWRCTGPCGQLIYNVAWKNGYAYPCEGAPFPHFVSADCPKVCKVCFDLYHTLCEESYWKRMQEMDKNKAISKDRLRPGNNYFAT